MVPGTSIRWSALLNSNRVTCGTASPMKPTGPQTLLHEDTIIVVACNAANLSYVSELVR